MAKTTSIIGILSLLGAIGTSQAACSRDSLKSAADTFFSTAISKAGHTGVKLASDVRIVQNNQQVKSLAETVHSNITEFGKPFRIVVLDEQTCNVATMAVTKQANVLALVSLRAKVAEGSGEVKEIEIVNAGPGSSSLFRPAALPDKPGPAWNAPLHSGSGAAPTHEKVAAILDTYPHGIQVGDGSKVATAQNCQRTENGVHMPFACNALFDKLKFPVTNRGYFVDMQTGITLAKFYFNQKGTGLWIHEYMKVTNNVIQEIYAVMINAKAPFTDITGKGR
jgi:hypothetical protein